MGVYDSMLRNQRMTTTAASSTVGGPGGQNLDTQLMIIDGRPTGKADLAFDAHELPIGQWAMAMWEEWLPKTTMAKMVAVKMAGAHQSPEAVGQGVWAGCRLHRHVCPALVDRC